MSHTHTTYAAHWRTTLAGVSLFYEHYGCHYLVVGNQFGRERALYKGHWACPTLIACETGRFINPIRDLPPLQKLRYTKRARGSFGHAVITTNAYKVNTSRISAAGRGPHSTRFLRDFVRVFFHDHFVRYFYAFLYNKNRNISLPLPPAIYL